jgi:hypothetical protein
MKQGRPIQSRNIRVTPEFRAKPDIDKLGRALIAVAVSIAEKKKTKAQTLTDKGDAMP